MHRSIVDEKYTYIYTCGGGERVIDASGPFALRSVRRFVRRESESFDSIQLFDVSYFSPFITQKTEELLDTKTKIRNPHEHDRVRAHRVPCFTAEITKTGASHRARRTDERKRTDDERRGENGER